MNRAHNSKKSDTEYVGTESRIHTQYRIEYKQHKHARTTQTASDHTWSCMNADFVTHQMESAIEIVPDPLDTFAISNLAAKIETWTFTRSNICFKKFLYNNFGHKWDIYDHLLFKNDLNTTNSSILGELREKCFMEAVIGFKLCLDAVFKRAYSKRRTKIP